MTIICYRDGVMACDSAFWAGGSTIVGHGQKIFRLPQGGLIGCSGDSGMFEWFPEWINRGAPLTERETPSDSGFGAVLVKPDGTIVWYNARCLPMTIRADFYACGAAETFATGALAAGATAEEAVRLAIKYTDGAGGEVHVERLRAASEALT